VVQDVECLPSTCEALGSFPSTAKIKKFKGNKKERRDNQKTGVIPLYSPVLLFGLHDNKVPLVVNFLIQEIVIFLEKEDKK
jgi:hypothetical protein